MRKQNKKSILTLIEVKQFDEVIIKSTENLADIESWLLDLPESDYVNKCIDLVCEEIELRSKQPKEVKKEAVKTPEAKKEVIKKKIVKKEATKTEEVKKEAKKEEKKNDLKVNDIREEFKVGLKGELYIQELDSYFNFKISNKKVQDVQTYLVSGKVKSKIAKLKTAEAYTIDLFNDDRRKKIFTMVICDFDLNKKSFRYADEHSGDEFHCKVTEYYK